jgi:hypothetical protein
LTFAISLWLVVVEVETTKAEAAAQADTLKALSAAH